MVIIYTNTIQVPDFYKKEVFWHDKDEYRERGRTTIIIK